MRGVKVIGHTHRSCRHRYANTGGVISRFHTLVRICVVLLSTFSIANAAFAHDKAELTGDWGVPSSDRHFLADLDRLCPKKKLYWISIDQMYDTVADFRDSLPRDLRRRVNIASRIGDRPSRVNVCRKSFSISCDTHHMIAGIDRAGLTGRFVRHLCAIFDGCSEHLECTLKP